MANTEGVARAINVVTGGQRGLAAYLSEEERLARQALNTALGRHTADLDRDVSTGEVTIFWEVDTSGLTPPSAHDTVQFRLYDGATIVADSGPISTSAASGQVTLWATSNGAVTGTPLIGTLELWCRLARTSGIGTYDITSQAASDADRGVMRINPTSATWDVPAADQVYGDVYAPALTLSNRVRLSRQIIDFRVLDEGGNVVTTIAETPTSDARRSGSRTINNVLPARAMASGVEAYARNAWLLPSGWNSSSAMPAIILPPGGARTDRSMKAAGPVIDPRLVIDHHLQVNDNSFDPAKSQRQRLASDLGFVTFRVLNKRDEPLASITATEWLGDDAGLVAAAIDRNVSTGNAAPYAPALATWDSALPGGGWEHTVTVTAPSTATGLTENPSAHWALLAQNPSYGVLVGLGHAGVQNQSRHWSPGDDLLIGVGTFDARLSNLLVSDDGTVEPSEAPHVHVGRFRSDNGVVEYLKTTHNAQGQIIDATWEPLPPETDEKTSNIHCIRADLLVPGGDPRLYVNVVPGALTVDWEHFSIFVIGHSYKDGTPYWNFAPVDVVAAANSHGSYALDPILAATGLLGTR